MILCPPSPQKNKMKKAREGGREGGKKGGRGREIEKERKRERYTERDRESVCDPPVLEMTGSEAVHAGDLLAGISLGDAGQRKTRVRGSAGASLLVSSLIKLRGSNSVLS